MSSQPDLQAITEAFAERIDLPHQMPRYAPFAWQADAERFPTLFLEDLTAIPFLSRIAGIEAYQYRARVRATSGDLFAAVGPPTDGYETYCRQTLDFGDVELVHADPVDGPMAVAKACMAGSAHRRLVEVARAAGGFAIHPYMSIDATWRLAESIARDANVPVHVLGPPPPVLWLANDKNLLCDLTAAAAGPSSVVESKTETQPAKLAAALIDLAGRHRQVAIKRTRCASAMGNQVYDGRTILGQAPADVEADVCAFLTDTEWVEGEPVLAVAWEQTDLSPSTQLWLPPEGSGPPRLDGIYEQLLEGTEKLFIGSVPSLLPAPVEARLAEVSLAVATVLQRLGYVGRCSFDFLVVGDPAGDFGVRLTECNGRWGGTSMPMHMVDRLIDGPRPSYLAQDFIHPALTGMPFAEFLARVGDDLYDRHRGSGRFVFYNVGCLAECGKFDVISFGDDRADAARGPQEILPRLLGL